MQYLVQSAYLLTALSLLLSYNMSQLFAEDFAQQKRQTVLYTPEAELPLYNKAYSELTKRQRWRRKIHGLRMTALNPKIWTIRNYDRTENRVLIPIRPFFLKASEDESYRLRRISFDFRFSPASKLQMRQNSSQYAPMLDIGIAGAFVLGTHGTRPILDRGYLLRLSAFEELESGLRFRSHRSSVLVHKAAFPIFNTDQLYSFDLEVSDSSLMLHIDGNQFISYTGKNLDTGLISLTNDWHPIYITNLKVEGFLLDENSEKQIHQVSGLVATE